MSDNLSGGSPRDILASILRRRDLSVAEASARLVSLNLTPAQVEEAIAFGMHSGYLNDRRLGESIVRKALTREPPFALDLIDRQMAARGLTEELRRATLVVVSDVCDLDERLAKYVRSRSSTTAPAKLLGRLLRSGHSLERTRRALRSAGIDPGEGE